MQQCCSLVTACFCNIETTLLKDCNATLWLRDFLEEVDCSSLSAFKWVTPIFARRSFWTSIPIQVLFRRNTTCCFQKRSSIDCTFSDAINSSKITIKCQQSTWIFKFIAHNNMTLKELRFKLVLPLCCSLRLYYPVLLMKHISILPLLISHSGFIDAQQLH